MTVVIRQAKTDAREKVWKVIRGLIEFSIDEVAILAEKSYLSVSSYVFMLYQSGYVRQAGKKKDESGKRRVVWRLARNTGPKAPVPCRCLYDPNIDDVAEIKKTDKLTSKSGGHHVA